MRKYLILFALLTVILTACRVESNVVLDINDDGSATVGAEIGFDDEFMALISQSGESPEALFEDMGEFGDDVVVTERTEGDMTYYGVFGEVDDLSQASAGSDQLEGFTSFSYTHDDSSATLQATIEAANPGDFGDLGDLGFDPSTITDEFFSANLIVTMPGTVTEHNADVVRGDGALVWSIPLTGTKEVFATSETGASTASWLIFILVLILVVGAIAAVVATVVSRKESQKAVEDAAAAHAADDGAGDDTDSDEEASDDGSDSAAEDAAVEEAPPAETETADDGDSEDDDSSDGSDEAAASDDSEDKPEDA